MKIETAPREDHQATLTVEIEPDKLESAKKRAARQLAKRGKIAGFRPGKAPYDVIRRQYGEEAILEGAIDILLDEIYPQALEESGLQPSGPGALEKMDSLEPPVFTFSVPLKPEVDLGDYRKIRLPFKWKKPNKKEVDAKLEELRKMYATTVPVERPIEENDYVLVDVVGTKVGADKGAAPVFEKTAHAVFVTTEKRAGELPFVGFASKLIGMSVDESKTISKKFPKSYEDEELREATVKYKVTVKTVHGTEFPELDDDFAKSVGAGETLAELRETIAQSLEKDSRMEYEDEYYTQLIDKIKEGATIKYPPQVVEHEVEHVVADIKERLAAQGLEFEAYLKMQNTTLEKFMEEEARPVAIKRLERGLIFDELARAEDIEVPEDEIQSEFGQTLMELQSQGYDLKNVKGGQRAQREIAENIAFQSASRVMTRLTLERIKAIATGELEKEEKAAKAAKKEKPAEEKDEKEAAPKKTASRKKKAAPKKKVAEKTEEK